uniref:hypothetical protein n=1 Tax=Candidatus Limisoma sp. TaxID=3076476 RepID=UPI003FEF1A91
GVRDPVFGDKVLHFCLALAIGKRTNLTEFLWGCYLIHIYSDFKISILVIMFKGKKSYWNKKGF